MKVMFRAHGEPPSTYKIAQKNNIELIDASCPVVLKLQSRIKKSYEESEDKNRQIVIYGKVGHAEVIGLLGQVDENAIVIESEADLYKLDFTKNIRLFSQTTKPLEGFYNLVETISGKMAPGASFEYSDTICRQVANRMPNIANFAKEKDIVLFVSGKKALTERRFMSTAKCQSANLFHYRTK